MGERKSLPDELDPKEAANALGLSVWSVYRRMDSGVLPFKNKNAGGEHRKAMIPRAAVEKLLHMEVKKP